MASALPATNSQPLAPGAHPAAGGQTLAPGQSSLPHVVIVGAGFGGLYAARRIAHCPVRVTVIDRENYHLFQPLLYQVATAALSPGQIAQPIRHILRRFENVQVLMGDVTGVDLAAQTITADGDSLSYDYLILATGARHAYFGHPEWEPLAPGLKSLADALEIRTRLLKAFEDAEAASEPAEKRAYMTFVIVGGGPTGVELAGAVAEVARHTVVGEYRTIDPRSARIVLVEGESRIISTYAPESSKSARQTLEQLGVEVWRDMHVTQITPTEVHAGERVIQTRTTFWAAGVAASPLGRSLGAPVDRAGRVLVEQDLTLPGHPEVYVVGDLASVKSDGKPVPGVAPAAMQEGEAAAENIWRTIQGLPRTPFHYWNKGNLAVIGRGAGVAEVGPLHLRGLLGWVTWLAVHIFFLIGFQNRLLVMLQWAWSYFVFARSTRLITGRYESEEVEGQNAPLAVAAEVPSGAAATPKPPAG